MFAMTVDTMRACCLMNNTWKDCAIRLPRRISIGPSPDQFCECDTWMGRCMASSQSSKPIPRPINSWAGAHSTIDWEPSLRCTSEPATRQCGTSAVSIAVCSTITPSPGEPALSVDGRVSVHAPPLEGPDDSQEQPPGTAIIIPSTPRKPRDPIAARHRSLSRSADPASAAENRSARHHTIAA